MSNKKIALVTGAGGGIGSEIARVLAADGYTIICVDKDREKSESTAKSLPQNPQSYLLRAL